MPIHQRTGRLPASILIANRGEIAVRIAHTCRKLGIRSIALFSEADADSLHVRACDDAVALASLAPAVAYLDADRIIALAREHGAEAVHPGYGFLAENAAFARACRAAGLMFIGPDAGVIERLGDKIAAKRLAAEAGVPTVPGVADDPDVRPGPERDRRLVEAAATLAFPLLVKASAGGGGRGMRIVQTKAVLADAIALARREALGSFGSDRLLVERYVADPRHVEVQVFGDAHGNVVHLMERDCSIQRRHQKLIEEAPAPALPEATRTALHAAAVRLARAVGYDNAGTVEFVLDGGTHDFYFLEVNTRLQVEHPVTEAILGVDLVEWQIRVAAGQPLPLRQDELVPKGWAIEARITAEDVRDGFRPQTGRIVRLVRPAGPGLRFDPGVAEGSVVSPYYDSMLAKVIAHGADRDVAIRRLREGLDGMRVLGLPTNIAFLDEVLANDHFDVGRHTTHTAEAIVRARAEPVPAVAVHAAAASALCRQPDGHGSASPWSSLGDWRSGGRDVWAPRRAIVLRDAAGGRFRYWIAVDVDRVTLQPIDGDASAGHVFGCVRSGEDVTIRVDDRHLRFAVHVETSPGGAAIVHLDGPGGAATFHAPEGLEAWRQGTSEAGEAERLVRAPGPGQVVSVAVTVGDRVEAGAALLTLEAMKMLSTVTAGRAGTVVRVGVAAGQAVAKGDLLVELDFAYGESAS